MEEKNPKHLVWLPFVIGLSASIGMYAGYKLQLPKSSKRVQIESQTNSSKGNQKLYDVLAYLESKYIDTLNESEYSDFLIQNLCYAIDPYTEYLKKSDLVNLRDDIDGIYTGAGLGFKIINSQAYISSLIPDGPAINSGIETGDVVKEINKQVLLSTNTHLDSVIQLVRSNPEKLLLKVQRKNQPEEINFEITKKDLSNKSIGATMQLDETSFYIKINRFSERTYREFMMAVEEFVQKKKLKNMVIDLRNNSGGLLDASADLLNQLIQEPKMTMFSTQDRDRKEKKYETTGKPFFRYGKIFVIVNKNSASASEVLAGSLQDLSKATIVGEQSFGKGTVLELFPLSDGSSLELATSRIFLPSGRCIQKSYDFNSDSTLNWLSPFQSDTMNVKYGNQSLASGKGIIPDIELQNAIQAPDVKITSIADEFVIQNFQEFKSFREKKNSETLIETFILKYLINSSNDKFIIKNKDLILEEVRHKLTHYFISSEQEEIDRLQKDPWIIQVKELIRAANTKMK
ncbi:MAG: PDZ domain-containing protein [Saprospiraceae bacterium]|nr:PDZ domain-containing protein [Saprospiraceae bacterium]